MGEHAETAILAGGCFWGVQELLRTQRGVISTRTGWSGGDTLDPTEEDPGTHAEAVEVVFDRDETSFRDILEFFFQIHDPTTSNRQMDDVGTEYRSAIFCTTAGQRRVAEETIADVDASGLWPGKVVTEVRPAAEFWEAEPDDQYYLREHPDGETCHFPRPDWKLPHRAAVT
jgi:peptide-methionine (S)-S-oxide reductase